MALSTSHGSALGLCTISAVLALSLACSPGNSGPKALYTLDASGAPGVYQIDAATGTTERVFDLPPAKWMGVTGSPANPGSMYAVAEIVGGLHKVRIDQLNTRTGEVKHVAEIAGEELGFGPKVGTGVSAVAMHPTKPHHGVLAVITLPEYDPIDPQFDENDPLLGKTHLVEVDFKAARATGKPFASELLLTSLTYDASGALYATAGVGFTASTASLYAIDMQAGELNLVGEIEGASQVVTGMAFDADGTMLAIDGMNVDELISLDVTNGSVKERAGKLGIVTPKGLVYI